MVGEPAYRTISDVSAIVGVPQHVLRFWETRFPQIAPLKRGGNRRYYRPADVELLVRISRLLHADGYTIKGVQKLLGDSPDAPAAPRRAVLIAAVDNGPAEPASSAVLPGGKTVPLAALAAIRDRLAAALAEARAA